MMKESQIGHGHGHAILITRFRDLGILHRATRLCHIGHTQLTGVIDRIAKGEKGITTQTDARRLAQKRILLVVRQGLGHRRKLGFPPHSFFLGKITFNVTHAGIDPILSLAF